MKANAKLILILWKDFFDIRIAFKTSIRLSLMSTMPAADTVMSEAELIAHPISA